MDVQACVLSGSQGANVCVRNACAKHVHRHARGMCVRRSVRVWFFRRALVKETNDPVAFPDPSAH